MYYFTLMAAPEGSPKGMLRDRNDGMAARFPYLPGKVVDSVAYIEA